MSTINPQEFGYLKAQVETLVESDRQRGVLLESMAKDLTTMRLQMAEAKGGWKVLLAVGGTSATVGSAIVAALHKAYSILS